MENPHKLIIEMHKFDWIWSKCRHDIFTVTIFTIALAIWIIVDSIESWWAYGIVLPLWYCLHLYRWHSLHKKNLELYYNWEETFGGKLNKKTKET